MLGEHLQAGRITREREPQRVEPLTQARASLGGKGEMFRTLTARARDTRLLTEMERVARPRGHGRGTLAHGGRTLALVTLAPRALTSNREFN